MREQKLGLKLLLLSLPAGSTLADARRYLRIEHQRTRTPSRLLDTELGIERD